MNVKLIGPLPIHALAAYAALAYLAAFHVAVDASEPTKPLVLEARMLLDTHFGASENLTRAAHLLSLAQEQDGSDAEVYVEAARVAIKGGHVVFSTYRPGTLEAYNALIDKAISLDSSNAKAHILKAESASKTRDFARMKLELESAQKLGSTDPWLLVGFGRYYWATADVPLAKQAFERVRDSGPSGSDSQRNAYVTALIELAGMEPIFPFTDNFRVLANEARRERHSRDAWILGNFADLFNLRGQFSDGIEFARDALQTSNYGAARRTLAVALYGRSAQLVKEGALDEAKTLAREARLLGFSRDSILERFMPWSPGMAAVLPLVSEMTR